MNRLPNNKLMESLSLTLSTSGYCSYSNIYIIINIKMQEEDNDGRNKQIKNSLNYDSENILNIVKAIQLTYTSKSTQQIKQIEGNLAVLFQNHPQTLKIVLEFVRAQTDRTINDQNFRVASANLIKKQCYQIATNVEPYHEFVQLLFLYLLEDNQPSKLKQIIGDGFQYILSLQVNVDLRMNFVTELLTKIASLNLENWNQNFLSEVESIMLLSMISINALQQIEQVCQFLQSTLHKIISIANVCLNIITNFTTLTPVFLYQGPTKLCQFMSLIVEKIIFQRELAETYYRQIRDIVLYNQVFYHYLLAFNTDGSIICKSPQMNEIKAIIIEFLYQFYTQRQEAPENFISLFLVTFLKGPRIQTQTQKQIISRSMQILELHIMNKWHYEVFLTYRIQILNALFLYSLTSPQEEKDIQENPQNFMEMANEYSQAFSSSSEPKIRAASLLKAMLLNIDDARPLLMKMFPTLVAYSLQNGNPKLQQFSQFDFLIKTDKKQKLDVCLMMLTAISPIMNKYQLDKKQILVLLMSHVHKISQLKDNLLLLRVARVIGYYPSSLFFNFLIELMGRSPLFIPECLCAFERISKNKEYIHSFQQIYQFFIKVVDFMEVGGLALQTLLMLNYYSIIRGNEKLVWKIIEKLKQTYFNHINQKGIFGSKEKVIVCLNYIEKLLDYGESPPYLLQTIKHMEEVGFNIRLLEDNFIGIDLALVQNEIKSQYPKVQAFVSQLCNKQRLLNLSYHSKFFLLVNKLITNAPKSQIIRKIFYQLISFMNETNQSPFLHQICHIVGVIFISNPQASIDLTFFNKILLLCTKLKGKLKTWLLLLIMHFLYRDPRDIRNYLIDQSLYKKVLGNVMNSQYKQKIERKIVVCGLCSLLSVEESLQVVKEIVIFCGHILKNQFQIYQKKLPPTTYSLLMNKRYLNQFLYTEEERMEDNEKGIEQEQFKNFSHPFDEINQFQIFKLRAQKLSLKTVLSQVEINQLRPIMMVEWYKDATRVMCKVKSKN